MIEPKEADQKILKEEFNDLKITQNLLDSIILSESSYKTLDEAKRISIILKERIVKSINESRKHS